jgi:hypothetical protein
MVITGLAEPGKIDYTQVEPKLNVGLYIPGKTRRDRFG